MAWVDLLIIIVIVIGLWQGFMRGFIAQLFLVFSIIGAILVAFWLFPSIGNWFEAQLHVPLTYARPIALAIVFIVSMVGLQIAAGFLQRLIAPIVKVNPVNRIAGMALGGLRQLVNVSIVLALLFTLPIPGGVKMAIDSSRLGRPLMSFAFALERRMARHLEDDGLRSLSYRIVGTDESTTTALNFTVTDGIPDETSEAKMIALVNATRIKDGAAPLVPNNELREVARKHAQDMLTKGYFSHVSPQGKDALVRVQEASISVLAVGENLANAPNVEIAHTGLLASPGHKRNILSRDFNEIGMGVIDAGNHGKMIVEVFAKRL